MTIPGINAFPEGQMVGFMLVLLRLTAFVFAMPVFGAGMVPLPVKILLSLVLSVVVFPIAVTNAVTDLAISETILLMAGREVLVGLFLGFLMRFFFFAISVAGELIGLSSGLATAQMYNPALGANSNVIEQFQMLIATLLFLALNGHHIFLEGMVRSFAILRIGDYGIRLEALGSAAALVREVIIFGVQLAAPVIVAVFVAQLGMGIIGKAVPQINVLVTSLQLTMLLTLIIVYLAIPTTVTTINSMMVEMASSFMSLMRSL